MVPMITTIRSSSIGPATGAKNNFFRDNSIYECNYETIDSLSSDSGNPKEAILSIEHAVKCIDEVLQKDNAKQRHKTKIARDNSKVQYDSITVFPKPPVKSLPESQPPPLPRTRSFKDQVTRARSVHPALIKRRQTVVGRASSAPPISPANNQKYFWRRDR